MKGTIHVKSSFKSESAEQLKEAVTAKIEKLVNIRAKQQDNRVQIGRSEVNAEGGDILPLVDRGQGQGGKRFQRKYTESESHAP